MSIRNIVKLLLNLTLLCLIRNIDFIIQDKEVKNIIIILDS
jgi:hypothetical protein